MLKRTFAIIISCAFLSIALSEQAFSAETKKNAAAAVAPGSTMKKPVIPPAPTPPPIPKAPKTSFRMLSGTLVKVGSDKIELKSDIDGSIHSVALTPKTGITKVTDTKDLKVGDKARIVVRSTDNKEVAMSITYGNIQSAPKPRAVVPAPAPVKK